MKLKIKKESDRAIVPTRAYLTDSGLDLYACLETDQFFLTLRTELVVPTGISIELEPGYQGFVCSRSGLAAKYGVFVVNSPGVIDQSYRGEIKVILGNLKTDSFTIRHGDRIAQLLLFPVWIPELEIVDDLSETDRGLKGLGSSGISLN